MPSNNSNEKNGANVKVLAIHSLLFAVVLTYTFIEPSLLNNQTWDIILYALLSSIVGHSIYSLRNGK